MDTGGRKYAGIADENMKRLKTFLSTCDRNESITNDPHSPYYSKHTFESLKIGRDLIRGLYMLGYDRPSKIQEATLPIVLAKPPSNLIAQSQSGTGKTAAFVLAMLSRINTDLKYPQAMCISPTYELAIQTIDVVKAISRFCPHIRIRKMTRGEKLPENGEEITENIIIGTPGKIGDYVFRRKAFDLKKLNVFVLDEADVMISLQGHHDQSWRIRKQLKDSCQILMFSATYDDDVMAFAEMMVPNPTILKLKKEEETLSNIRQFYVKCESKEHKYQVISNLYGGITIGQAIIFAHTKHTAHWLALRLKKDGHAVALLMGELDISVRLTVLDDFKAGKFRVLVTTNVLSRGIDIDQVTLVVNFDLPLNVNNEVDCETYLHRIGRTGRFGKRGLAIDLIDNERSVRNLALIEEHFRIIIKPLNTEDPDELAELERRK